MAINNLLIPYPDFKLQEVMDPEQFDLNNKDVVDKVNELISVVNGNTNSISTINTTSFPLKADKTYVDSQNNSLQTQITNNKSTDDTRHSALNTRITGIETNVSGLGSTKADKTYVDAQITAIQNGQIADNAVTTVKVSAKAITESKLADKAVTSRVVDGTTVYSATQVDNKVSTSITASEGRTNTLVTSTKKELQDQIDANKSGVLDSKSRIDGLQNRVDNLAYNVDLYSAKQDIMMLALNLEVVKGAQLTGISENMVIETMADVSDLLIIDGFYNNSAKAIYLP